MEKIYAEKHVTIPLGKWQEHLARQIVFDVSNLENLYGPGRAELLYQRSGDERPHVMPIEYHDHLVTWNITNYHTDRIGYGSCELRYYVGEALVKSETWTTSVASAMALPTDEPITSPEQSWIDQVLQAGQSAENAANRAEDAAIHQPMIQDGTWWTWDIGSGAYQNTGIAVNNKLDLEIVQSVGNSTTAVMSQKAVSDALKNVPDYVYAEANRVAKIVQNLQNEHTFSFLALSDMHYQANGAQSAQSYESLLHASQAAKIIRDLVHLDFAAMLGDVGWGYAETIDGALEEKNTANHLMACALQGLQNFRAEGNHDKNTVSATLASLQAFNTIGRFNQDVVHGDTKARNYCYKDLDPLKVRVIVVNTSDPDTLNEKGDGISKEQLLWFANSLDLSNKVDASEWSILLLSHEPIDFCFFGTNASATYTKPEIQKIVEAYASGNTITVNGTTFDYSEKNTAPIIGNIHGHLHNFAVGNLADSDVKRLSIPNVVFTRNNEYGSASAYPNDDFRSRWGDNGIVYNKYANSANDTSFCIVTVDLEKQIIYASHYGAGVDRQVSYTSFVPGYTNYFSVNDENFEAEMQLRSNGNTKAGENMFVSGYVPCCAGDVIYVSSPTSYDGYSAPIICGYNESKTFANIALYGGNLSFTNDSKTAFSYAVASSIGETGFVRIGGIGNPQNFVITINEPIPD